MDCMIFVQEAFSILQCCDWVLLQILLLIWDWMIHWFKIWNIPFSWDWSLPFLLCYPYQHCFALIVLLSPLLVVQAARQLHLTVPIMWKHKLNMTGLNPWALAHHLRGFAQKELKGLTGGSRKLVHELKDTCYAWGKYSTSGYFFIDNSRSRRHQGAINLNNMHWRDWAPAFRSVW